MAEREVFIRRLTPQDDRADFRCGDPDLDRFFQKFAGQNQFRHHLGVTYVAVVDDTVAGFATVSVGEITGEKVSAATKKKLPDYPLPVLRLARLGVDQRFTGLGLGTALLRAMFTLALELRDQTGCTGVVVDAKSGAVAFYERLGFLPLQTVRGALRERPEPLPMFLPIGVLAKAAKKSPVPPLA